MYILGISCHYHDAAAALLKDGVLVAAAEEERFTKKKHDSTFPVNAIDFCLEQAGIDASELDYIVFYEKPFLKFERILLTILQTFPKSLQVFREAMIVWLSDKLWVKSTLRRELRRNKKTKIIFTEHHISHAASAYYSSPYQEAAVMTADGVGEWATATLGIGRGNKLEIIKELRFPHSIGLLYSVFTAFLGFEVNDGEYKVMGMAPYGQPRYVDKVRELLRIGQDGSLWLDMDYFSFHYSTKQAFTRKFEELFGPPREPETYFFTASSGYPSYFGPRPHNYEELCEKNQYYADVAASIQTVTEEILLTMARHLHETTGLPNLCFAGGVALNSVANGRILRETPFTSLYVQPAASDAGGALGAAQYAYHHLLGNEKNFVMEHALWGKGYSPQEVKDFLTAQGIPYREFAEEDSLLDYAATSLGQGKVVGWFQGRFEWGPRALGSRSILADPRREEMKDIVNTKIKFREPYRPFAPVVLAERACDFFEISDPIDCYPARFMLLVAPVKPEKHGVIPAVTHVDGTGRLQTVHSGDNTRYRRLLERFDALTGVPVLLNTSFNLRGEPIVNSPADAYSTFVRSDIDILVLENFVVEKTGMV
ncbi:MAG: hypothetical protein HW403_695 [Dehalococcoidia bacterium]|nr:hypothetical protein [Dehalococcoidia bacterium]